MTDEERSDELSRTFASLRVQRDRVAALEDELAESESAVRSLRGVVQDAESERDALRSNVIDVIASFYDGAIRNMNEFIRQLRAALAAAADAPQPTPRPERKMPRREDVLAYHRMGDGDIEDTIDYALSLTEPYEVPRWDEDRIVIEHGWLDGRCGRCGEPLATGPSPAVLPEKEQQR